MNNVKTGFSRICITPPLGTLISGYYEKREAKKIVDDLYVNTVAFDDGIKKAVVIHADIIMLSKEICDGFRKRIASYCNIPMECIFLTCSHTHTGPMIGPDFASDLCGDKDYEEKMVQAFCDSAKEALDNTISSEFSIASGEAKNISFIRRFRMKDGGVQTNPGIDNPNIDYALGTPNEEVQLLKIEREGAEDIYIVCFGTHPDSVGGDVISADYPGYVRYYVEKALDGVKCVFLTGAQGDVNHINPAPTVADRCGLDYDSFDGVPRGIEHAKHMGRTIAGAVLQICGKTEKVVANEISFDETIVTIPANQDNSRLDEAKRIVKLHTEGKDDVLPYSAMELTTVVAEATRICTLSVGPESYDFALTALKIGDVAFAGLPGEPFVEIGRRIAKESPFKFTFVCCLTNGGDSYFPTSSAYDEGGYEARSSYLKKGGDDILVKGFISLLKK